MRGSDKAKEEGMGGWGGMRFIFLGFFTAGSFRAFWRRTLGASKQKEKRGIARPSYTPSATGGSI